MTAPTPQWAARPQTSVPEPGSPLDRQFAAFIGPRWETYRRKFAPFFEDARFQPTWNWSAALPTAIGMTPLWFVYRRMYLPALLIWMVQSFGLALLWGGDLNVQEVLGNGPRSEEFKVIAFGVQLSMVVLTGGTANYLLYRRARAAMRVAERRGESAEGTFRWLERVGRVNMIGVVIVVALFAFAGMSAAGM